MSSKKFNMKLMTDTGLRKEMMMLILKPASGAGQSQKLKGQM